MIWKLALAAVLVFHLAIWIQDEPPPPPLPTTDQGYGIDPDG